jgi:hypothetical protein
MSKMWSHDPFGHLKHKLWPKERSRVKLTNWLLTTKSRESLLFPCVQVVCQISLESSRWGLQIYFRPRFNRRFAHKVMGPQSWGIPEQNNIWVLVSWVCTKYIIRGKVVASSKFVPWWISWIHVCLWFVRALKML